MRPCRRLCAVFLADHRGGVSVLTALALPALIATLALGTEVSYWLTRSRGLQNAADSAVVAASMDSSGAYLSQAKAVTARYGLVDGVDGVTVSAANSATCPDGSVGCYSVTIATTIPVYLGAVIGYVGNTSVGSLKSTRLSAVAFAKPGGTSHEYCLVGLAGDGHSPAIASYGLSRADLTGCSTMSNSAADCGGFSMAASFGDAVGTINGCGNVKTSGVKALVDPFAGLAAKLPSDPCGGSYPQLIVPAGNRWSGTRTLGSVTTICGDLQLTGNVTIIAPSDAILIIRNGELVTQGYNMQTAAGSGLAIIFTGSNNLFYQHVPTGAGGLDIAAPTTGTWSGVAMYQDPALTYGVQIPGAATVPRWKFSGLIYLPHADLSMTGAVSKATNGAQCTALVANSISVNSTALVLSTVGCATAGLNTPDNGAVGRGALAG